MKISVALATYNGAEFLNEQLASLVTQTRPPDELVVSDDGSSDDTLDIIRRFARSERFPVVVAPTTTRLGFADNFLNAVRFCSHELVAFCDQDDVWLPRKLELGAQRIAQDGSLLSMHTLTVTDAALEPTGFVWKQDIEGNALFEALDLNPFYTGWGNSMMFRRDLAGLLPARERPMQSRRESRPLSHDTWIYALAAALGRVSQIDSPLILYRQHGATATGDTKPRAKRGLSRYLAVPFAEYEDRRWFDGEMERMMTAVADQGGPFADAARLAQARFEQRTKIWDARLQIFDGRSLPARLSGYNRHRDLVGPQRHWLGSRIKDIVVGISGLDRLIRSRRETSA